MPPREQAGAGVCVAVGGREVLMPPPGLLGRADAVPPVLVRLYGPEQLPGLRSMPDGVGGTRTFLGVGSLDTGPTGQARLRPVRLVAHTAHPAGVQNGPIERPSGESA